MAHLHIITFKDTPFKIPQKYTLQCKVQCKVRTAAGEKLGVQTSYTPIQQDQDWPSLPDVGKPRGAAE